MRRVIINSCPHGMAAGECPCKPGGCHGERVLCAGDKLVDKREPEGAKTQPQPGANRESEHVDS